VAGGSVLGALLGTGAHSPLAGIGLGMFVGVLGGTFTLCFAVVAFAAGYGAWKLREWGRMLCIGLAALSLLFSLPGLLMMGVHFGLFLGGYRLIRIAISVLIIWYLIQPQVKALFQSGAPAMPRP